MATETTPMMKQYWELKKQHPNAILFFRVGDFYEMFHDDAIFASKILEITLTSRDKNKENAVPLCGIPFHAGSTYINKLIKAGHAVAICEQIEDPAAAKGVVKREVQRIITPGTLIEPDLLSPKENNYVAALHWDFKRSPDALQHIGLAFLDLSTAEFRMGRAETAEEIESALSKINPKEIVLPAFLSDRIGQFMFLRDFRIRYVPPLFFIPEESYALLTGHFHLHAISALGDTGGDLIAAGALLRYVQETQKKAVGTITSLTPYHLGDGMRIHSLAQRHLNLIPKTSDVKEGTLLQLLDKTTTAMGGRLLRHWLLHPLLSPSEIKKRQEGISFFHQHPSLRQTLMGLFKKMADPERLISRIGLNAAHPRDLVLLKASLFLLPEIGNAIHTAMEGLPPLIQSIVTPWDNLDEVAHLIDRAIAPDPPFSVKEGGVIREGYLAELDEVRKFGKTARERLAEMEQSERKRTGIDSLKIRYNQVFGYSIEVSETHLKKIPPDYIRKQTLTHAERFTTLELSAIENRLAGVEETIFQMEAVAFDNLCETVSKQTRRIQEMARRMAMLDCFLSFAEVAHQNRYVCPVVNAESTIQIIEGRHPVLESTLSQFVPNDTLLDSSTRLLLITGPNMAGKSTYMQQVALIVLMAQIGSFVPAREATIGVVDQIFARVGAQDFLVKGMSTFMVEMTEMAQILRQATSKSLILLDELGRGTSTYDGMSIAWAISEYIHRLGARTLFATHYHELTQLSASHSAIRNYHVMVREYNDEIIFLRKIVEGGADKSYGIEVGRLAGLPPEIIKRAKEVLSTVATTASATASDPPPIPPFQGACPITSGEVRSGWGEGMADTAWDILKTLRSTDPNTTTPMQAMQILADLSEQAKKGRYPQ